MSKLNTRLSIVRPVLLGVALLLCLAAMTAPALAACTPGSTLIRTVSTVCCDPTSVTATVLREQYVCNSSGVWVLVSRFCASATFCVR